MKGKKQVFLLTTVLLLLLTAGAVLMAQTSADFNLAWHVIGSGGSESSSADYRVNGTAGQSLASPPHSSSASYGLSSGFWVFSTGFPVYLPLVANN